jgi:hypothetical protein
MADGFIWYELVTNDMDKAVNFYKKVVGWDVKDAGMPGFTYMIFGKDGKDVGVPLVFYFGNESPNIGFPLLDCCWVASS